MNALSLTMGNDKFNIPKAPTKEEMSFRTYTARQRLNRLRRAACKLFTSDTMVKAIQRLELEVEAKRLLVRKDRHLWKDIGMRCKRYVFCHDCELCLYDMGNLFIQLVVCCNVFEKCLMLSKVAFI